MGVEPTSQAWEARILPMYYTREIGIFIRNAYIVTHKKRKSKVKNKKVKYKLLKIL